MSKVRELNVDTGNIVIKVKSVSAEKQFLNTIRARGRNSHALQ